MTPVNTGPMEEVFDRIQAWPPADRLTLAQKILSTLGPDLATRPRRSLRPLVGLLKREGAPPSDEEVARIIDEELTRKYGP